MDDDLYVVDQLDEFRSICISTLARRTVEESDASHLGGDRGYFIYETDSRRGASGVNVLAKAASFDAAFRLADLWSSLRQHKNLIPA
jgi:hypothetical protein